MTSFFNFDIEQVLREIETFRNKFTKDMDVEMENIEKAIRSGKLKGKWDFKKISEPGVKGYIVYGQFSADHPLEPSEPLEPFDPLRPSRREPTPGRSFKIPSEESEEIREPLTDIFEEEKALKLYVELPGEEKEDIQLNIAGAKVEVKSNKFYKEMNLPTRNIVVDKTSTKYKNGVLEITIPKAEKTSE